MKKINILLSMMLISSAVFGQIQVDPEKDVAMTSIKEQARIRSTGKKPYWIGTGTYPHIHFDSSSNHKIGIGVAHKSEINRGVAPLIFTEHAKVHIRHEGGPGSQFQAQKGPHLLLDEATAINPAVLRFRQSTLEPDGLLGNGEVMTPGDRYWDIRGFANGGTLGSDEFRIVNSGAAEDLLKIDGEGDFTFSGDGSTRIQVKGPVGNNPVKLEFGDAGTVSNGGRIWYHNGNDEMTFYSNGVKSLEIDNGFVQIGSNTNAPKIKTAVLTAGLPLISSSTTTHNILPVTADKILSCDIFVTNLNGLRVKADNHILSSQFSFFMAGTSLILTTLSGLNSVDVFGTFTTIFLTYTE